MSSKSTLIKFFIINAFMSLSCNMVHPITPAFLTDLKLPDYTFGIAFAAMMTTNFILSPFWGTLSDSVGRLRITRITLIGYAFSQFLFMISGSVSMVLFSRLVSGVFAGGFTVCCTAYLADITDRKNRAKYMMYYVAFSSVSASLGYLLGGFIGDYSLQATFISQIVFLVITVLLYQIFLKDFTVKTENIQRAELFKAANPFVFFIQAKQIMTAALFVFLITVFLTSFSMTDYDNALNFYIRQVFHFQPSYSGILKAVTGMIGLVANFTINQWLVKHTDGRRSMVMILFICGGTLLVSSQMVGLVPFLVWNTVFYCFNTMYLPIQQALVSEGQQESSGLLFGIFNSVKSLGSIGGALVAGFAYDIHHNLPFVIAGVLFFVSAALGIVNYRQYKRLPSRV